MCVLVSVISGFSLTSLPETILTGATRDFTGASLAKRMFSRQKLDLLVLDVTVTTKSDGTSEEAGSIGRISGCQVVSFLPNFIQNSTRYTRATDLRSCGSVLFCRKWTKSAVSMCDVCPPVCPLT